MRRRALSAGFYALFAAFLVWYVSRLDLRQLAGVRVGLGSLAGATVLALGFRYWGVTAWLAILSRLGARLPVRVWPQLAAAYAKAWLGRYVPGKVAWVLGRIHFASEHGVPKRILASASVVEGALQVAVSLFLSLVLLTLEPRLDVIGGAARMLLLAGSVALLVAMAPPVFNRVVALAYTRLARTPLAAGESLDTGTLVRGFALFSVSFALTGVAYFAFTHALFPVLGRSDLLFVVGAFNLAGVIGMLSLFAPSGLGVRESVQLLLLPLVMPPETALAVTVAARIWSVAVDLLFYAITRLSAGSAPSSAEMDAR